MRTSVYLQKNGLSKSWNGLSSVIACKCGLSEGLWHNDLTTDHWHEESYMTLSPVMTSRQPLYQSNMGCTCRQISRELGPIHIEQIAAKWLSLIGNPFTGFLLNLFINTVVSNLHLQD